MNWRFTRRSTAVAFERDEPFCMIFPMQRATLEATEPEFRRLEWDPEVKRNFEVYAESWQNFNRDLDVPGSAARTIKWQKYYTRGMAPFASAPTDHRTKIGLRHFAWPEGRQ